MERSIVTDAPARVVWDLYTDIVAWRNWTATMRSVEPLDPVPLKVGSRVRIFQPRVPTLTWVVDALDPTRSWSWQTQTVGATTIATQMVDELSPTRPRVTQQIDQRGLLGTMLALLHRPRTGRYLTTEGRGLAAACEQRPRLPAAQPGRS